jgi:hypothetical protein
METVLSGKIWDEFKNGKRVPWAPPFRKERERVGHPQLSMVCPTDNGKGRPPARRRADSSGLKPLGMTTWAVKLRHDQGRALPKRAGPDVGQPRKRSVCPQVSPLRSLRVSRVGVAAESGFLGAEAPRNDRVGGEVAARPRSCPPEAGGARRGHPRERSVCPQVSPITIVARVTGWGGGGERIPRG